MNKIKEQLEQSRLELLDMGLRGNSLLHFRIGGAKALEIDGEHSLDIYTILVEKQRSMIFLPAPEEGKEAKAYGEKGFTDNKLQTLIEEEPLDRKLLKISTEARSFAEEKGVEVLYLALGFLHWFEDESSEKLRRAPLMLVPVNLLRTTAKERFKLSFSDADLGPNLTLAAKMNQEFRLSLPPFEEEFDLAAYFSAVEKSIEGQERWSVDRDEIALGFFSFGKFQMYQDLDSDGWPEGKKPEEQTLLKQLLGPGFSQTSAGEGDGGKPAQPAPVDLHFVKDADSSQTEAVMLVKQGANLVIQGPPGTGKSQTITNIISESLSEGKSILFVAEKMAALEVVKRRLDQCHLGDSVLELHSHKSKKKAVLGELKKTLDLGKPNIEDRGEEKQKHVQLMKKLDDYCEQVAAPILNSQVSYIDAVGHHIRLKNELGDTLLPELDFGKIKNWSAHEFTEASALLRELCEHLKEMGPVAQSPFAGSLLEECSPLEEEKLARAAQVASQKLSGLKVLSDKLSTEMRLAAAENLQDISILCHAAQTSLQAPDLRSVNLKSEKWILQKPEILEFLEAGSKMQELKTGHEASLIDNAWTAEVLELRQVYKTKGKKWWRIFSGAYRQAKNDLLGYLKGELPDTADKCLELIDAILLFQSSEKEFEDGKELGEELFGSRFQGDDSDWTLLKTLSEWMFVLFQELKEAKLPEGFVAFLEAGKDLENLSEKHKELERERTESLEQFANLFQALAIEFADFTLTTLEQKFSKWKNHITDLHLTLRYNRLKKSLEACGLAEIGTLSFSWQGEPEQLLLMMHLCWYSGLVNEGFEGREALRHFDRIDQENTRETFRDFDEKLFHYAQESLVNKLHAKIPDINAAGEMALIRHEMNKKRRHIPIRRLISESGRAIQQIKPVFMMGPMSVATYLEQGAVEFDLLIFDEASQIKVVDAFGAILRAKQVVVVGDTKQMPPTNFFSRSYEADEDEESQTADLESILGMFLAKGAEESMLRWHYRSRHDSLIAVSNHEFYEDKLMIFPSPGINPDAGGLKHRYNPDSIYERGSSSTNPIEAREVAEAVFRHLRRSPQLTLGVVAFSIKQRDCILLEVERLRRERPECEFFFSEDRLEPFFVKNLENVQGDERDGIYISMGYGRMDSGKVSQSFPLINRDGGERRLNVLITRARLTMEIFSNFRADDLRTTESTPFGVRVLKSFMHYAETKNRSKVRETGKDIESPFEDEVFKALRCLGYEVEPQVGSAGFYIDMALRDPNKPGRYILAVECDGASYHSSASARDRDRLRQSVLEGLGWRFHRVWSTDWFRNSQKEIGRLKESISRARHYYEELDIGVEEKYIASSGASEVSEIKRFEKVDGQDEVFYQMAEGDLGLKKSDDITDIGVPEMADAIRKLIDIEGAIYIEEVPCRIAEAVGFSRVGRRIKIQVAEAMKLGRGQKLFHIENDFVYLDAEKKVTIRNRSKLDSADRDIDWVPPEEISQALLKAVALAFSLSEEEAISEGLHLLGFYRSAGRAKELMQRELQSLLQSNELVWKNAKISINQEDN
jgi:very-short-patch-repair endonuclease